MTILAGDVLADVPDGLRGELLAAFSEITRNFRQQRWEPSELNGGKFCEVVYSILRAKADGTSPSKAEKPKNMVDACRALEVTYLERPLKIQIPRMLVALYEIRNNRGVGHVGGDVDPNHMDAATVSALARWVLAELVRAYHGTDTATATDAVDSLIDREVPTVWRVGSNKRVLDPGLSLKDKTLLLLYGELGHVAERDLLTWVERTKSGAVFRRDILRPAHRARLIEFDEGAATLTLSPVGIKYVEAKLLTSSAI